ncbi:MAG: hypothetical protein M3O92_04395 [Actinomycetota bacterium]|nr:hypothetical protein [Actinomycetota bacterium]
MSRVPDFDDLVGKDVPEEERQRLRRAHDLLVRAGPPPELSPELDAVQWPEDSQRPPGRPRQQRLLLLAAALATAAVLGFVLGQSSGPSSSSASIDPVRVVKLAGTSLDRNARGTLALGKADKGGNWPMLLHATGLRQLPEGGYYDLYLTKGGKPVVLCGSFNVRSGEAIVRFSAAYDLSHFDRDGWVITRQLPSNHQPTQIVLKPTVA